MSFQKLPEGMELLEQIGGAFGRVLKLYFISQEEMEAAAERYPRRADAIFKSHEILKPTMNMTSLHPDVYRAHARELLGRVGRGQIQGAELGTAAEVMLVCSEGSLKAPLNQVPLSLYARLFDELMESDLEVMDLWREPYPGAVGELENELRRKLADPERKSFIKETLHGHQEAIFDLAA